MQNGATIVCREEKGYRIFSACNEFTQGVDETPERLQRPLKYLFTEHAERNVIYMAAKEGWSLEGSTMVALWAACADCARAIVQSGVVELVRHGWFLDNSTDRWKESIAVGDEILQAGGVKITRYDKPIRTNGIPLRFDGKEILPWS